MKLFRAHAFAASPPDFLHQSAYVFFEAKSAAKAERKLITLLAVAWGVPEVLIEHIELVSEDELTPASEVDQREPNIHLFCATCSNGRRYYIERKNTQFLVRPTTHRRLLRVQAIVEAMKHG